VNLHLLLIKLDSTFITPVSRRPRLHGPSATNCVIPVDGLIARGNYEDEFTLHQFTILPGGAAQKFKITEFAKIKID
jgi:hypothetical protein